MAAVQPRYANIPLDCSTRYQVLTSYRAIIVHLAPVLTFMPKELVALIGRYFVINDTRAEEHAQGATHNDLGYLTRTWTHMKDSNAPLFFALALDSDLFRFASHGVEATLPRELGPRFQAVEDRVCRMYPQQYRRYESSAQSLATIYISPLDLPRLPLRTLNRFNPYRPLDWGTLTTNDPPKGDMWSHPGEYVLIDDNPNDWFAHQYHPRHDIPQSESLFLAPFRNGEDLFCPLAIQSWPDSQHRFGDKGGLIDGNCNLHVPDASQYRTEQQVYLPIARAVVGSSGYCPADIVGDCRDDIADWALTHNSRLPYFSYYRTRSRFTLAQANSAATVASTSPAMATTTPPAQMNEARAVAANAPVSAKPAPSELIERRYFM